MTSVMVGWLTGPGGSRRLKSLRTSCSVTEGTEALIGVIAGEPFGFCGASYRRERYMERQKVACPRIKRQIEHPEVAVLDASALCYLLVRQISRKNPCSSTTQTRASGASPMVVSSIWLAWALGINCTPITLLAPTPRTVVNSSSILSEFTCTYMQASSTVKAGDVEYQLWRRVVMASMPKPRRSQYQDVAGCRIKDLVHISIRGRYDTGPHPTKHFNVSVDLHKADQGVWR